MKYLLLIISFFFVSTLQISAQEKNDNKVSGLYAFGYMTTLNDSVVYLTEIAPMPKVEINKKNGFLVNRSSYTAQLKDFATKIGIKHPTCAIIYDKKKKNLEKKFVKMTNRLQKKKKYFIKAISSQEFTFKELTEND